MSEDGLIIMKPQKFNQYNDVYNVKGANLDHCPHLTYRIMN